MCSDAAITVDLNSYTQPFNIEFNNLNYLPPISTVKTPILKNVSGQFMSGHLTAILGPSGAGKSTLLNILSGFKINGLRGSITINGETIIKNDIRYKSSYIEQDFAMLEKLTTWETLRIAADLKMNSHIAKVAKIKVINDIVELLKLRKCLHTQVGRLSGGEKKRLSIGVELITNPPIMFFDEPTSGLDSLSAIQVVTHLRELARDGRTIVVVIHQPASQLLELFDDLYVLSDGKCIYNGSLEDMCQTFKEVGLICPNYYNRADFALELASLENDPRVQRLVDKFSDINLNINIKHDNRITASNSDQSVDIEASEKLMENNRTTVYNSTIKTKGSHQQYAVSQWKQFVILTKRSTLCCIRDFLFAQMRLVCHILVGLLLGIVFYDIGNDAAKIMSNSSCLFFFLLFIFFANSMPTVITIPLETSVFLREHLNNWYSLGAYYFSKIVADLPLQFLCPTSFILIAYYMTSQPLDGERLLMLWFICFLTTILAHTLGLIAGAAFNMQMGIFLVPASCIPMLILSGFFIKFKELFHCLQPLSYFSYFRYSFEGSIQAIYGYNRQNLTCSEQFCYLKTADKFLQFMDMSGDRYWNDVFALIIWIIILQILLFAVLKYRLRKAR